MTRSIHNRTLIKEMSFLSQLEMYENHPLYREILKIILKSQIQILVDQLSAQIGEETVILTASLDEGKITDIGTQCGRDFLKGHNDVKVNFLGFCMKRYFENQTKERDTVSRQSKSNPDKSTDNTEAEIQGHEEDTCTKESVHENDQASTNRGTQPDLGIDKGYIDTDIKPGKMEQEGYAEMDTPVEDITKDEHGRFFSNLEQADENDLVHGASGSRDSDDALPWLDQRDQAFSLQDQIISKRKQKAPKRKKTEPTKSNMNTIDLTFEAGDSETEVDLGKDERNSNGVEYLWTTDQISDLNHSPIRNYEDKNISRPSGFGVIYPKGTYREFSVEESSLRHEFNKYEIQLNKQGSKLFEEIPMSNRIPDARNAIQSSSYATKNHHEVYGKAHSPVPQPVDGLLVTRGAGRFEKLLKCELCGKICRTSNMARHKKRYCLGASSKRQKYENLSVTDLHGFVTANHSNNPLKAV